jgi:hypothetical protein
MRRTKDGQAVHDNVMDHHPVGTRYQRFNKAVAIWIVKNVGTMTCYWLFTVLALLSLPATLHLVGWIPKHWIIPSFFLTFGFIYLIQWIAQSYLQLVLLPSIMVGQTLQNAAADVRSAKSFEDTETILDRLDLNTQGGITEVMNALTEIKSAIKK